MKSIHKSYKKQMIKHMILLLKMETSHGELIKKKKKKTMKILIRNQRIKPMKKATNLLIPKNL